jgi:hypothetical protein
MMVKYLQAACLGLLLTISPSQGATDGASSLQAEYLSRKATAGLDAESQVRLALWCEEHGLAAERLEHLQAAIARDPGHALARGLLGEVEHGGKWLPPTEVKTDTSDSASLDQYRTRRAKIDEFDEATQKQVDALKRDAEAAAKKWEDAADQRDKAGDPEGARQNRYQATITRRTGMRKAETVQTRRAHAQAMDRVRLGNWCEQNGLKADATVEYTLAVHLNPSLEDAWRHLGYIRHEGRWMPPDEAQAARDEARAQASATKQWEPLLKKWKGWLTTKVRRESAEENFAKVNDPRAIEAVRRVLITGSVDDQTAAVKILSAIERPASTRMLAYLAVFSAFDEIRQTAVATLKTRPSRDYAQDLVNLIHKPATYKYQPVLGPGSYGVLLVDTPRFELERSYEAPVAITFSNQFYGYVGYDHNGLPIAVRGAELRTINAEIARGRLDTAEQQVRSIEARTQKFILDANIKAAVAQETMMADIREIERSNAQTTQINAWAADVLGETQSAPNFKDDEDSWQSWWYDQVGYRYTPPEKVYISQQLTNDIAPPRLYSCFVAGTPVTTLNGPRPIETIRPGERVLTQSTETGLLGFQPVLTVHRNPPSKTVRLTLDNGEEIVPSVYHRFWLAGKGWALARDLKRGDVLRGLSGRIKITKVTSDAVVPVFNLDVARDHTYFVGKHEYLVHDNTLPPSRSRVFDAVDSTQESKRPSRAEQALIRE